MRVSWPTRPWLKEFAAISIKTRLELDSVISSWLECSEEVRGDSDSNRGAKKWLELGPVPTNMVEGHPGAQHWRSSRRWCVISRLRKLEEMAGDSHTARGLQMTKGACGVMSSATFGEECTNFLGAAKNNVVYQWNK